mgnify:CR=1 FL=1
MEKTNLIALSGVVFLVFGVSSCLSPAEQAFQNEISESQSSKISISAGLSSPWSQTRAGEEVVPAPIMYYLFDSDGVCVETQLKEDATTKAEFSIDRGTYKVFALCGDVSDRPSKANAESSASFILPTTTDVCLGSAEISVTDYGMSKDATVGVSHLFSAIALSITEVPSSVTSISATFSDLYESQSLEGEFSGVQEVVVNLTKSTNPSSTWYFPERLIYPCSKDTMKVKIEITSEDGTKQTIATTTAYSLKSGKKITLTSLFRKLNSVSAGVVMSNGWTSVSGEIDFWNGTNTGSAEDNNGSAEDNTGSGGTNTGDSGNTPSPQDPNGENTSSNPTYNVGERFNETDAFVLRIDNSGENTVLLLQSVTAIGATSKTMAETQLQNYKNSCGNDYDWRIPTEAELDTLMSVYPSFKNFKNKVVELGASTSSITDTTYYGYMTTNNLFYGKAWGNLAQSTNGAFYFFPVASYSLGN